MTVALRLRTHGGNSWPPLPPAAVSPVWACFLELERSQWRPAEEIEARQLAQLRLLLAHCVEHVPYYRELGIAPGAVRSLDDVRRLPVLSRETCHERAEHLQADRLPPGTERTGTHYTSGTTGVPVGIVQTNVAEALSSALSLRDLVWCDMDPRKTLAVIKPTPPDWRPRALAGVAFRDWAAHLSTVIDTGPCHVMDIHQEPGRQLEWLAAVDPAYVVGYPSNLDVLAGLASGARRRWPALEMIQTYGETLTPAMAVRIGAAFGVPVTTTYSTVEGGYLASPCPEGHGFHVHAENVLLEVLDGHGHPCVPGEVGRVLLTTLHGFAMPLIRYAIGDEAEVGPPCPCGRALPSLARVLGKERPLLRLPDGRLKSSAGLVRLWHGGIDGVSQFQVVQHSLDHVAIRIVPDAAWTAEHPARIVAGVQAFFEAPIRVEVDVVDRLERSAAGKVRTFEIDG